MYDLFSNHKTAYTSLFTTKPTKEPPFSVHERNRPEVSNYFKQSNMRLAFIVSKTLETWAANWCQRAEKNLRMGVRFVLSLFHEIDGSTPGSSRYAKKNVGRCFLMEQKHNILHTKGRSRYVFYVILMILGTWISSSVKDWTLTLGELQVWQAIRYHQVFFLRQSVWQIEPRWYGNIYVLSRDLKMIFLFPSWDMLVSRRVTK